MGKKHKLGFQQAIGEKAGLYACLNDDNLSDNLHSIKSAIYKKRIAWLDENFDRVSKKLKGLSPVEKAFTLVFFEYMGIDPKYIETEFFPERKKAEAVFIRSSNPCPYLEAFKILGFDDKTHLNCCKMTLEEPVYYFANEFLRRDGVPYGVWFSRNYEDWNDIIGLGETGAGIRPQTQECQEYFIDRSLQVSEYFKFRAYEEMFRQNLRINFKEAFDIANYPFTR